MAATCTGGDTELSGGLSSSEDHPSESESEFASFGTLGTALIMLCGGENWNVDMLLVDLMYVFSNSLMFKEYVSFDLNQKGFKSSAI